MKTLFLFPQKKKKKSFSTDSIQEVIHELVND